MKIFSRGIIIPGSHSPKFQASGIYCATITMSMECKTAKENWWRKGKIISLGSTDPLLPHSPMLLDWLSPRLYKNRVMYYTTRLTQVTHSSIVIYIHLMMHFRSECIKEEKRNILTFASAGDAGKEFKDLLVSSSDEHSEHKNWSSFFASSIDMPIQEGWNLQ